MSRASDLANLVASGSTSIHGEAGVTSSDSTGKTTNLQQGLAKAWWNLNGTGTVALRDSFNISSVADDGTGEYDPTFTNNMGNVNYSFVATAGGASSNNGYGRLGNNETPTTSAYNINTMTNTGSDAKDHNYVLSTVFGDLA